MNHLFLPPSFLEIFASYTTFLLLGQISAPHQRIQAENMLFTQGCWSLLWLLPISEVTKDPGLELLHSLHSRANVIPFEKLVSLGKKNVFSMTEIS